MTSLLRYWLSTGTPAATVPETSTASSSGPIIQVSPPSAGVDDGDNEGSETETEHQPDDDRPPAFPSLSSAQRVKTSTPSLSVRPRVLTDAELMPPPPLPNLANRSAGVGSQSKSMLAVPPTTTKPPTNSKKRGKVALAPGHSPLDWAKLTSSGEDLRVCWFFISFSVVDGYGCCKGVDTLLRIPPSLLKQHNKRDDAWAAFSGKVYNITPYLSFHPGGEKELMRVAGRDGTRLFGMTAFFFVVD